MNGPRSRYAVSLQLLLFGLVLTSMLLAANNVNNALTEFQRAYQTAGDAKARRDLVIKAIDDSLIKRGLTLADAKVIFGEHLQTFRRDSTNKVLKAVVFFEPAKPPPNPLMSALRQGWYLDLAFSSGDRLEHYSLSNLHK